MTQDQDASWPNELRVHADRKGLSIVYADDKMSTYTAEFLRVFSPSAEVQGHSPEQRQIIGGKRQVALEGLVPVGNYAVRIRFSDGHETGIFTWDYFAEMAANHDALWAQYEADLKARNLSRD